MGSTKLVVRDRLEGKQREMTLQDLVNEIQSQTQGKPFLPLNLPKHLSVRPQIMV
jgi:threonyl-tRNA synthetase